MTIFETLVQLRDDLKLWVTNNLRVKLDKNLGVEEKGKLLSVDNNGDIKPIVAEDALGLAPLNSPVFTGTPYAPTVDYNNYDENIHANQIATCGFVLAAIGLSDVMKLDVAGNYLIASGVDQIEGATLILGSNSVYADGVLDIT